MGEQYKSLDKKTIGKRIREERIRKGLTNQALAEELGISLSGFQNYQAIDSNRSDGNTHMNAETLSKIAQVLGVTTDYLLGLTDDNNQKPIAVDELGLSPKAVAWLAEFHQDGKEPDVAGFISDLICSEYFLKIVIAFSKFKENVLPDDIYVVNKLDGMPVDTIDGDLGKILFLQAIENFLADIKDK